MQISGTGAPELVLVNNGSVTGRIEPETGCADMAAGYKVSGVRVIGPRQPGINDAQSLEEVTARLNEVLAVLRAHGLIEPKGVVLTAKE